jgi:hypothetical protein
VPVLDEVDLAAPSPAIADLTVDRASFARYISQVWADLRVFRAVAGRRCLPLAAAVAVSRGPARTVKRF